MLIFTLAETVRAIRWGERKRLWRFVAASFALVVSGSSALLLGMRHPTTNFWAGQGFGSNWACENLGKASAQVCFREAPRPAGQASSTKAK
jgi:hypothetical protein